MADAEDGKSESGSKEEKSGSSRWWEFYFVRYALGTVFGILIIRFLASHGLDIPFPKDKGEEFPNAESLPLLLGYGLAYCYLASAPILLFHATRFQMRPTNVRLRRIVVFCLLAVIPAIAWFMPFMMQAPGPLSLGVVTSIAIYLIALLTICQFWSIYVGQKKSGEMWQFYLRLDRNRRVKANRELIDSYRHLREHGNAFAVVLLEMLLGLGIFLATKISVYPVGVISERSLKIASDDSIFSISEVQVFALLLIWTLPAASVWAIGCYLEAEFANDKTIGEPPKVVGPDGRTP